MMKKAVTQRLFSILLALILLLGTATIHAEGLLPSLTETIGIAMPSLGEALGRYPDSETENADGSITEQYTNVSEADFDTFSVYLKRQRAELADYSVQNGILTAEIRAKGGSFSLEYAIKSGETKVNYPAGTFDERTKNAKTHFDAAKKLLTEGKTDEALAELLEILQFREYGPAVELLRNNDDLAAAALEAKLAPYRKAGNIVVFGTYPQSTKGGDRTPIEWIVLDFDEVNLKALLLSRYGLEARRYNTEKADITWETCTLRSWLNDDFLNAAFSAKEQSAILITEVDNSASQCCSSWTTSGGNNTQDKAFLLSYAEIIKYFGVTSENGDNIKLRVSPTNYAIKTGAWTSDSKPTKDGKPAGWWWLRSPGLSQRNAARVRNSGSLDSCNVDNSYGVVRPALWINLDSDIF